MNDAHAQEIQTIFNALNSSKKGLSSIEAKKGFNNMAKIRCLMQVKSLFLR